MFYSNASLKSLLDFIYLYLVLKPFIKGMFFQFLGSAQSQNETSGVRRQPLFSFERLTLSHMSNNAFKNM